MKTPAIKYIVTTLLLLAVGSVAAWYFKFYHIPLASHEEIGEEFGKDPFRSNERALLDSLQFTFRNNAQDKFTQFIVENKFPFRGIFHKLVQKGLYYRFVNEPDSAKATMELANAIANVYRDNLDDDFLSRQFGFCDGLSEKQLHIKLTADLLYNKGQGKIGKDNKLAKGYYENSLKLSQRIGDDRLIVDNLQKIQYIFYAIDQNDKALETVRQALELSKQIGYRWREAWSYNYIGSILLGLDKYHQALENFASGLKIAKQLNDQSYKGHVLWRQGYSFNVLGMYDRALAAYDSALAPNIPRTMSIEAKIHNDRGLIYRHLGDYNKAEQDLLTTLAIAEKNSLKIQIKALAFLNLGELYRILGAYEKALAHLSDALQLYMEAEKFYDVARVYKIMGDIDLSQQNYSKALKRYYDGLKVIAEAEEVHGAVESNRLQSLIKLSIGDVYLKSGDFQEADNFYSQSLANFQAIEFTEGIVHALTRLGNLARRKSNFDESLQRLKEAQKLAENEDPLLLANAYYSLGLTYKDIDDMVSAEKSFVRAIEVVESSRKKITGQERITYFATIQDFYDELIQLLVNLSKDEKAFEYCERSRARAFLDILVNDTDSEAMTAMNGSSPEKLPEIQAALGPEAQVIEYKVTKDEIISFVFDRDMFVTEKVPINRDQLNQLILRYRCNIGADADSLFRQRLLANSKSVFDSTMVLGEKLYNTLIKPVEKYLDREKTVYIIADGILNYLPFSALATSDNNGESTFLIENFTLAYAPSASVLKHLLDNRKTRIPIKDMRLFAVADPTGDLEYAGKEVSDISKFFFHLNTLIGIDVTEEQVINNLNLDRYHVVHFATHGYMNEKSPSYSFLALGGTAKNPGTTSQNSSITYDNRLLAKEVSSLNLSEARLVVLSACETEKGRLFRGEGVMGFSRAFIKAGAPSIITTYWNIADKYAHELVVNFYKNWLTDGENLAVALQTAQVKLIKQMREDQVIKYPHPYAWAAFNLIGDFL